MTITATINGHNLGLNILIKPFLLKTPPQPPSHSHDDGERYSERPKDPEQLRHDHTILMLPVEEIRAEDRGYESARQEQRSQESERLHGSAVMAGGRG
ncbi:hypothetical protein RRF57_012554 [Xylaria bambusicola]|uniref:Uncharacterized protein n=1 Tax=Xylaria bambusicola TaxID=326684 RepID=A0AAN7ZB07_9PEZI